MLATAYRTIGKEIGAAVADVGLAFYDVYIHNGDTIDLYDPDLTHPSLAGSCLAALKLFATVFDADPIAVSYAANLPEETYRILQEAAR